ncbi:NAD(P)-dependent oxidoreductase [Zunongwangia endophytica]|uniref:NAD(P)-dependent oxidoreductase n=1 Tax=Zunongwangia endophytica TaxID=1808945 RepID=A0ABV8H7N6_9FLAO|nr:NAD(P)-dependent oxidoreductase [Zunongwangia endophytica]MDN3593690.1 NAD(P)-dependent oxidoreductase [Zunongwangia endophytica]
MDTKKFKIGWIGLGKMGVPMAKQVLKAGYPVRVYNRSSEKNKKLETEGATSAESIKELVDETEVIFIMVSDNDAVKDVFNQADGILSSEIANKIFINASTIAPEVSVEISKQIEVKGGFYLDAPVSGSVKQAEEMTLVSIVGGSKEIFEKTASLLKSYSKKAIYVGENGVGNSAKLAVNTYLGIVTQGLAEIIQFSKTKNVETADLMDIINNSALGSTFGKMKGESAMKENFEAAFTLAHLTKDLRLAQQSGFNKPLGNAAYKTFSDAEAELGEEDVIAIIKKL